MKTEIPTTDAVLLYAADLIERGHCKGAYARDKNMRIVYVQDKRAVSYCAVGALRRAAHDLGDEELCSTAILRLGLKVDMPIDVWNDAPERTAAEVAAMLRQC